MADVLSRERIAALRRFIGLGLADSADRGMCVTADKWRDLLAALDAYEAQRLRPASDPPEEGSYLCLLEYAPFGRSDYEWATADYRDGEVRIDFNLARARLIAWLPQPPTTERDDG